MAAIDDLLDAIRQAESGGNDKAVSPVGAQGPYQFMPATAKEFGLKGNEVFDPVKSREAAQRKVSGLLDQYGGDTAQALAAYNMGQGNLAKLKGDYTKVPETKNYVAKVMNMLNPISSANASEKPWTEEELMAMQASPVVTPTDQPNADAKPWTEEELMAMQGGSNAPAQDWQGSTGQMQPQQPEQSVMDNMLLGGAMGIGRQAKGLGEFLGGKMTPENQAKWDALQAENAKTGAAGSIAESATGAALYLATAGMGLIPAALSNFAIAASTTEGGNKERLTSGALSGALTGVPFALGKAKDVLFGTNALKKVPTQELKKMEAILKDATGTPLEPKVAGAGGAGAGGAATSAPPKFDPRFVEGIKPTAGMVTDNPTIADLETMARLTNKGEFFQRDAENKLVLAKAIKSGAKNPEVAKEAKKILNAKTTPMREAAMEKARLAGMDAYTSPMKALMADFKTNPETMYDDATQQLLRTPDKMFAVDAMGNSKTVDPASIYRYMKKLDDGLNRKGPPGVDVTDNAIKNAAREAAMLKDSMTKGLDDASGGLWKDYTKAHSAGMAPITEARAWDNVLKQFDTGPQIMEGVPNITAGALRRAVEKNTFSKAAGGRDLLSKQGRSEAQKMINTVNAMERAASPRAAISGSQTTPLAVQLAQKANKAMLPPVLSDLLTATRGFTSGQSAVNNAVMDPELLKKLVSKNIKN
jgi:hypothetical protein